jgi:hypothetical protein
MQPCHLYSNDGATTGGFLQSPEDMTNGPRTGQMIHHQKFRPLDMTDDGQAHWRKTRAVQDPPSLAIWPGSD